jgi:hypothetical protein
MRVPMIVRMAMPMLMGVTLMIMVVRFCRRVRGQVATHEPEVESFGAKVNSPVIAFRLRGGGFSALPQRYVC